MPKLIVKRKTKWYLGLYDINIFLDEDNLGEISNNQVREIELTSGDYVLKAKLKWTPYGSDNIDFKLSNDQNLNFIISYSKHIKNSVLVTLILITIVVVNNFVLESIEYINGGIIIFLFLNMIYSLFFNSNKYLEIHQQK